MNTETLVDYQYIDVSARPFIERPLASLYVVLRGEAPLVYMLPYIVRLQAQALEVAVEDIVSKKTVVISSRATQHLRPAGYTEPVLWREDELEALEAMREHDTENYLLWDLEKEWEMARGDIKAYLMNVYRRNPEKESVILQGACPMTPAGLTYLWFSRAKSLTYQEHHA